MRLVVDANILISALLGSRKVIALLTESDHTLFAPRRIVEEIVKHRPEVCRKAGYTAKEFEAALHAVLAFVTIQEFADYEAQFPVASKAMAARDPTDADYIACALALNADAIWTQDKDFSAQGLVPCKATANLVLHK